MLDNTYVGTNVVHYFAKQWVKMGYDVKVIHIKSYFPHIFYLFGKLFKEFIKAKTGSVVHTKRLTKPDKYMIDDVSVLMIPAFKLYPRSRFSEKTLGNIIDTIVKDNDIEGFIPDYSVGHFRNPQLQILYYLKNRYLSLKTGMVLHCSGHKLKTIYPQRYEEYLESLDILGFRSKAFKIEFEKNFNVRKKTFICHSGIPDKYLNFRERDFKQGIHKYCFVGSLFKLKRVENTIKALYEAYPNKNFSFDIVGDGAEKANLVKLTQRLNLENNICFHGKLSRDHAQEIIYKSDIFVMVSFSEAFGLSYVEALAKGCITIGTKNQGIDGVIIHGINGFLCESDNIRELSDLFIQIQNMDQISLQKISHNGYNTAKEMTDFKEAESYLKAFIAS